MPRPIHPYSVNLWNHPLRRRWILWSVLAATYIMVSIYRLSSAVLADDLMRAFQTTGAELGALHASFFYVYAPLQVVAGVLADRYGPRRTAAAGAVVMNLGAIMFAVTDSYVLAFVARLVIGLGGSVIFISILRFCANWYRPTEFASMSGVTVSIAGVGGILATYPLAVLVEATGWREAVTGLGVVGVVLAGLVYVLVRDTPKEAGVPPIDGVLTPEPLSLSDVWRNVRSVFREARTWIIGLIFFFGTGVNITVFGLWGVPYVVQMYDVSVTHASIYTLLGSVGLVVGPPVIGWLSDRLRRRTALIVLSGVLFTAAYGLIAARVKPPLPVVGLVFFVGGLLAGGFALGFTVMKERHGESATGTATGTVNAMGFLGAAVFPGVMGYVLDAYWTGETVAGTRVYTALGYRIAFVISALAGAAVLVLAVVLHLRRPE